MQFVEHLRQSAEQLIAAIGGAPDQRHAAFIEAFQSSSPPSPSMRTVALATADARLALSVANLVLRADGFDTGAGPDFLRQAIDARFEQDFSGDEGWLAWVPRNQKALRLALAVHLEISGDECVIYTSRSLPSWSAAFEQRLAELLRETPERIRQLLGGAAPDRTDTIPHDVLLGPGERIPGPHTGTLLDYSGCATAETTADLTTGALPFGRSAFGFQAFGVTHGPDLFLGTYRTGAPMMYNGTLVCAPQNSGKTRLILRWALAANRAGISVLVVDVKGNMYDELAPKLRGRVYHFSTDPRNLDSDGINFLANLDGDDAQTRQRVRQLVDAILPSEGWEAGEQAYFHQNHVNWLTGLIQIILLYQHYYPAHFVGGTADLGFVYDMAANEATLYRVMNLIRLAEAEREPLRAPGLAYWTSEIALLVSPDYGGQRTPEYSYRTLTQSITNALRPFSEFGTLFQKTSRGRPWRAAQRPERNFFTLDTLNDPDEPVTIILAAREQDVDDAATVVSMVVKRLQHTLFDRMNDKGAGREMLLLLDETRRIRSFAPEEYITFARQARAGCVIVYQSLDQIGDDKKIRIILENVGTQIYLGSLVGETARHFIHMLPKRRRPTYSSTVSGSLSGDVTSATQTGSESVDYLSTAELYRLPAGKWPALVYLNDQPRRDPILVDTDEALTDLSRF